MLRHLLLPVWLGQLLTSEKSFERNAVIGNPWLNAHGLHTARVTAAHRLAAWRRRRLAHLIPAEDRARLDRDGFIVKHDFLPPPMFQDLVAQVRGLRAPARQMVEGDTITRRIALEPQVLAQVPAVRALLELPAYRNLIRYAGSYAAAPMVYLETILTQATVGPPDPQTQVHADTFHPTVKAWLYLSDAAADAMPLYYVPGSHRLTPTRLAWERQMSLAARDSADPENRQGSFRIDPESLKSLGLPPPQAIEGLPNTLIVADTFGFHARGRSPSPASRVEIWAFGRRNPFLPMVGLDPWTIDALGLRKPVLYWRSLDLLERAGLARQRWKGCGDVSPFDPPAAQPLG
ncbi:MAG: phytanoyl-CoA dioxygenase family protein [Thiohalocapsa sp.]